MRAALVAVFAALVVLRLPEAFTIGRFWAEEGAVYFLAAWTLPWLEALTLIHTGYLNLAASAATLLAADAVPLEQAPFVSSGLALLVQLLPAVLLATSGAAWLASSLRLALALLLVLAPPNTTEVWLNAITSQFHLALACALALALPPGRSHWASVMRRAALIVGPLSGPVAVMLAPLFVLRAGLERTTPRLVDAGLIVAASAIETLIVLTHGEPGRTFALDPAILAAAVASKHLVLPFAGLHVAAAAGRGWRAALQAGQISWPPLIAAPAALAALGIAALKSSLPSLTRLSTRFHHAAVSGHDGQDTDALWLSAAALVTMLGSTVGALTNGDATLLALADFGGRYAYVPQVLFGLALLRLSIGFGRSRFLPLFLVAWLLVIGAAEYFPTAPIAMAGPSWRSQVALWRRDPTTLLKLWPEWFSMYLPPRPPPS